MSADTNREDPPGLDLAILEPWLADAIGTTAPLTPRLLAGGRSNLTYELTDADGRRIALRRQPLGHVMPSAHDMVREFTVMAGLGSVDFPVPPALVLCEDTSVIGVPFMVTEFVDGRVIGDAADAALLSSQEADASSRALVDTLADLHRVDAQQAGLLELGRPDGYLARQVGRWTKQWGITKTRELPIIDELQASLTAAVEQIPAGLPWSIVHGDYRIDNLILDRRDPRVLAVVDWEMATLGDPIADLAITLVYWSQADDVRRSSLPVAQHVTSGPGFWTREQIVHAYTAITGFDVSHLDFCVALACYKLAVIMESIHFRNLAGQQLGAAADRGEDMGRATEVLAEVGLAVTRDGAIAGLSS